MQSSHGFIPITETDFTTNPVLDIIRYIYCENFSSSQHQFFLTELKKMLDSDRAAAKVAAKSKSSVAHIVIHRVPEELMTRWNELVNIPAVGPLATDEDFLIMHHMLKTRPALIPLNKQFNNCVLDLAYRPLPNKAAHLFPNPIIRSDRDKGELLIIVGTIGVLIALIFSTVVGMYYAAKKAYKSLINIFRAEKVVTSLFRLVSTVVSLGAGIFGGMMLGAMVGSVYPGIGTVLGTVIGGIAGSGIGAGLGALLAKQVGKLISLIGVSLGFYGKESIIVPTNPEKYRLNKSQILYFRSKGITDTTRIYEMMESAQIQKSTVNTFFDSTGDQEKNEYNSLIRAIKSNPEVTRFGLCLNPKTNNLFIWSKTKWERYGIVKPEEFLAPRPIATVY